MTVFGDLTRAMSAIVLTTFGEPVVFHIEGQAEALPGRGVFSAANQEVDASTGVPVSMVQPVLEVRQADLPATPTEGDAVTVQGVLYLIVEVRPDGHGFLKLMLHKGGGHEASTHPDP
ncbi:MAG: hypothetical protein AAB289_02215 [Chloroflexota bacterium]|jgi:hypothetical protein